MKLTLMFLTVLTLGFGTLVFAQTSHEVHTAPTVKTNAVRAEALKIDPKMKKNIHQAQKDVNAEVCNSGQEKCSLKAIDTSKDAKVTEPRSSEAAH